MLPKYTGRSFDEHDPSSVRLYVATAGKHQPRGVGKVVKVARERSPATSASPPCALFGSAALLGAGSERPERADGRRGDLPALRRAAGVVVKVGTWRCLRRRIVLGWGKTNRVGRGGSVPDPAHR